jgi:hypothetical protein
LSGLGLVSCLYVSTIAQVAGLSSGCGFLAGLHSLGSGNG